MRDGLVVRPTAVLLVVALLAACSVRVLPSNAPSLEAARPSATVPRAEAASPLTPFVWRPPAPTIAPEPPAELARSASVERDGVRVTITLDRNPMPAGEPTWVTTEVVNQGDEVLHWATDGCEIDVHLSGAMDERFRAGIRWAGEELDYKVWAFETVGSPGPIWIEFREERFVDLERFGCGDIAIPQRLAPGGRVVSRMQWAGDAGFRLGPPPSGAAHLVGRFGHHWWESEGIDAQVGDRSIEVALDAWILGGPDTPLVHPAEAVDIALADPELGRFLLSRPFRDTVGWLVEYVPEQRAWHVGLQAWPHPPARFGVIDGFDGTLREVVVNDVPNEPGEPDRDQPHVDRDGPFAS